MSDVVYRSRIRLDMDGGEGKLRRAYLPAEESPVLFGVHGEIAQHYGISGDVAEPHATTIDYLVASAAG